MLLISCVPSAKPNPTFPDRRTVGRVAYLLGMKTPSQTRGHHLPIIIAGIALIILATVGIYGLVTGSGQPQTTRQSAAPTSTPSEVSPSRAPLAPEPPQVEGSTDPDMFARNLTQTLFTWDTTVGLWPLDYSAVILAVGDPSGTEQAGLASDLTNYLPSRQQWVELRKHSTSQTLTIDNAYVPDAWAGAVEQAAPGQIPAGATAITVEGTRHRSGTWEGHPVADDSSVSFTVFLACPKEAQSCHVLRLSGLNNPLK